MRFKVSLLAALIVPMLGVSASAIEAKIAPAPFHSMFVDAGNVYGMGWNRSSAIKPGDTATSFYVPGAIGVGNVKSIATGMDRSAVLRYNGTVALWGKVATTTAPATYSPPETRPISDIALTDTEFYYIVNGEVHKWNFVGTPSLVSDSVTGVAVAIAAGSSHVVVQYKDGTIGTIGSNAYGQLGNGTTMPESVVLRVAGVSNVSSIAAGQFVSLAVLNDGTVVGFGRNHKGQLGNGGVVTQLKPIPLQGLTNIKKVASGYSSVLALTKGGVVRAAGWHNYIAGALYNTNKTFVDIPGLVGVADIAAGGDVQQVSFGTPGVLNGWGGNVYGKLGDNTQTERHVITAANYAPLASTIVLPPPPVVVQPTPAPAPSTQACNDIRNGTPFTQISASTAYACSIPIYVSMNACIMANPNVQYVGQFCKNLIVPADRGNGQIASAKTK